MVIHFCEILILDSNNDVEEDWETRTDKDFDEEDFSEMTESESGDDENSDD